LIFRSAQGLHPFRLGLVHIFVSSGWYYATLGLLTIYFQDVAELSVTRTGFLLLVLSFLSRSGRLIVGSLGSITGARNLLVLSHVFAGLGYLTVSLTNNFWIILLGLISIAIAYSSIATIGRLLISSGKGSGDSAIRFSILHISINIASAAMPFIAIAGYDRLSPQFPFHLAMTLAILGALLSLRNLPEEVVFHHDSRFLSILAQWYRRPAMVQLSALSLLTGLLQYQFYTIVPLEVSGRLNSTSSLATIYLAEGLLTILLSIPINKFLISLRASALNRLVIGIAIYSLGVLLYCALYSLGSIYAAIVFWSSGGIILMPAFHSIISDYMPEKDRATLFALNAVGVGSGQGIGAIVFVSLYNDVADHLRFLFSSLAGLVVILVIVLLRSLSKHVLAPDS